VPRASTAFNWLHAPPSQMPAWHASMACVTCRQPCTCHNHTGAVRAYSHGCIPCTAPVRCAVRCPVVVVLMVSDDRVCMCVCVQCIAAKLSAHTARWHQQSGYSNCTSRILADTIGAQTNQENMLVKLPAFQTICTACQHGLSLSCTVLTPAPSYTITL
jgi:hypothetical protein